MSLQKQQQKKEIKKLEMSAHGKLNYSFSYWFDLTYKNLILKNIMCIYV